MAAERGAADVAMPEQVHPEVHPEVQALIAHHGFTHLPVEGTLFKATYSAPGHASSAMLGLYCDEPPSHSLFHRLSTDEVWHFYGGDALRLLLLHADGSHQTVILGPDHRAGQQLQWVVPAFTWQAGHLLPGGRYALFGCTLAPGFNSTMFEGGTAAELLQSHPQCAADIERWACPPGATRMPDLG